MFHTGAGQNDVGDVSSGVPSPGAGYAAAWGVSILDGDKLYLCDVRGESVNCSTLFGALVSEITGVTIDSPAVFDTWQGNSEWNELLAKDDISILLQLQPAPGAFTWSANITVNGATDPPYGGNFTWNIDTGDTVFITY